MRFKIAMLLTILGALLVLRSCRQQSEPSHAEPTTHTLSPAMLHGEGTLHVRVTSCGTPEDVLIGIHGGPGNSSGYLVNLQQLATSKRAVVLYDQRGTGQSS